MRITTGSALTHASDGAGAPPRALDPRGEADRAHRGLSVRSHAFLLVLAVALPLGALLVAALRQVAAGEEAQAVATVQQVARLAAARADLALAETGNAPLDAAGLRARTLDGMDLPFGASVVLATGDGVVVAKARDAAATGSRLPAEVGERLLRQREGVAPGIDAEGEDTWTAIAPLARAPWSAVASIPASAPAARRSALLDSLALTGVVLLVLLAGTALNRRMLRPIRALTDVARDVARGDLAARAPVDGPRELADIAAGINRMLDERARDDAALRESEARFRSLADSAPSLIWMAGADGSCTYVNRPWLAYTGRSLDETCGDGWAASIHGDDRAAALAGTDHAFERRAPVTLEFRLRRHDGEYRWMLNQGMPRCADDGTLIGYVGTCVDIHDRVMAERRIRRLSTLYAALSKANEAMARTRGTAALLQQVCDIAVTHGGFHVATVGLIDEAANCVRTKASAGETYGFLDRMVLGLGPDEPRHDVPSLIAMREDRPYISNDRERDARTVPVPHPVARDVIKSTAAFPLHQEGRVIGFLTVHASEVDYFDREMTDLLQLLATDLSFALDTMAADARREEAEGALRQLNATLEQKVEERTLSLQAANRELEAFGYSVSHDLRAPLRAIGGFTELIAESHLDRLDHEARGYLERVRAAAQRMSRLIDDLMNLSRIARLPLAREQLDVSRLAAEVVAELQENDPQRAVQVRITPGLTAHADRGLAQIVLANLLGNAWKFTARRSGPAISVGSGKRGGRAMFFVRDNGAGFDMKHADKLFAPFQRLHAEQEFAGTGIGLALVQRIVQRHGGQVEVESAENQGTVVYFTLGADAAA